ncbi:hypothetical protein HPB48_017454 [Haemaphysalis longicornis]|uniref:Uncharacterized protein n=1 Tax=Haemaphysalis longicornis TaxID=44386 RepID=A0A9J6FUS3_HAELO|nr:hypothetical protein HPB48_017454 [Haemaphysalis longicornis]
MEAQRLASRSSADTAARRSSYGSARTAESEAREAWARHPYYSSQEEASRAMYGHPPPPLMPMGQPMMRHSAAELARGPAITTVPSKQGSLGSHRKSGSTVSGPSGEAAGMGMAARVPGIVPSERLLQAQIEKNREVYIARQKELQKKQQLANYRAMRERTTAAPSLAALVLVAIWVTLVSGVAILAFGWIFTVFVQATPFFYVSMGTGSSLIALGAYLTAYRSKTPVSVAFGV